MCGKRVFKKKKKKDGGDGRREGGEGICRERGRESASSE